ncbi:RNAse P Rpr2/Rpp21/SNM1 subunit domain-containing protein [Endogone sp. FLAS-F59071]|nr:RNAse P Rpr2/Rpp21/SNM1 subunit domain-containing protein [Endogone sp. FLAS-F59071]|eukprot:RUS15786.1 RNAse P Rpr2/Rpp21/SNM1 subunit domain-containing protein [Endogone sp. FLAS-F59071]
MAAARETTARLTFLWSASHKVFAGCPSLSSYYMHHFQLLAGQKELSLADAVRKQFCSYCAALFVPGVNCTVEVEKRQRKKRRRTGGKKQKSKVDNDTEEALIPTKDIITTSPTAPARRNQPLPIIRFTPLDSTVSTSKSPPKHRNTITYHCYTCGRTTHFPGTTIPPPGRRSPVAFSSTSATTPARNLSAIATPKQSPSTPTRSIKTPSGSLPTTPATEGGKKKNKKKIMDLQSLLTKEKERERERAKEKGTVKLTDGRFYGLK